MTAQPERTCPAIEDSHPCSDCGVRLRAICGVLASDELEAFRRSGMTVQHQPGDTLFFEGDEADFVYNLTAGALRLSKLLPDGRRQIAGFVFPGDFLGITMEEEHAFTAEAIAAATLCRFPRARFEEFVESHPHLEKRLYALAAHELAAARRQIVLLGRKTAAERVASFLLMLDRRDDPGAGEAGDDEVVLPMARGDIADYLGLRIETVSRELSALKAARLIQLTGPHGVRLLDRGRLETLADG
jgi:CRP/FNR family transcriptional regulator